MGVCLGVIFEPKVPEAKEVFETDGKCLASELSALDEICETAGVTPFSTFVDTSAYDISEEELEEIPEEIRAQMTPCTSVEVDFGDCTELMATIAAIRDHLASSPADIPFTAEVAEAVSEDLTLLQKSLEIASQAGAKCMLLLW